MPDGLAELLDKADRAIAACDGVVDQAGLDRIARLARHVRSRASYPEEVIVVALAGGTGSGKSSLFNALGGSELTEVGGVRPTTSRPLATADARRLGQLQGYLDAIGVARALPADVPEWLCLIDLPDTDSVEVDHRMRVEALLPLLDIVVWVVDPEKYRDASLHNGHLRPLSAYSTQFVFVLNQADRLDRPALDAVISDLEQALTEDGLADATVVATSALPAAGPPRGIDALLSVLERRAREGGVDQKLMIDLEQATASLLAMTGGRSTGFEERAAGVSTSDGLLDLLDTIAEETGDPVAGAIRAIAVTVPDRGDLSSIIDETRDVLRKRALAIASLTELSVAVGEVKAGRQG